MLQMLSSLLQKKQLGMQLLKVMVRRQMHQLKMKKMKTSRKLSI